MSRPKEKWALLKSHLQGHGHVLFTDVMVVLVSVEHDNCIGQGKTGIAVSKRGSVGFLGRKDSASQAQCKSLGTKSSFAATGLRLLHCNFLEISHTKYLAESSAFSFAIVHLPPKKDKSSKKLLCIILMVDKQEIKEIFIHSRTYSPMFSEDLQKPVDHRSFSRQPEGFEVEPQGFIQAQALEAEGPGTEAATQRPQLEVRERQTRTGSKGGYFQAGAGFV